MIPFDVLRTFLAVFDEGSVIGASRVCGFSPAAVSRQMGALQRRTGLVLFVPEGRGIRPTAHAERLADEARRLMDAAHDFARFVGNLTHDQADTPSRRPSS
jgi:DNA-binding transcriptional LysR family regulator